MAESKEKIPLTGIIRVPEEVNREIDAESARLGLYKYEMVQQVWEFYKTAQAAEPVAGRTIWPKDVRDGDSLLQEFIMMLCHPAPADQRGKGGIRRLFIDHLRDPELRAARRAAKTE